jgi:S-adenosylmethionine decarboxylase
LAATELAAHCILELHGCPPERLDDLPFARAAIETACERSGCTLLQLVHHEFSPQGLTMVALLAESHLSLHTWPEHGYAAVDLFTCGDEAPARKACLQLAERFAAVDHSLKILHRGAVASTGAVEAQPCPVRP